jgi:hypothetical protein
MWGKKWRAKSVDAVIYQDYLVSVLALRNVSKKRWWVDTDRETRSTRKVAWLSVAFSATGPTLAGPG